MEPFSTAKDSTPAIFSGNSFLYSEPVDKRLNDRINLEPMPTAAQGAKTNSPGEFSLTRGEYKFTITGLNNSLFTKILVG